MNELNEIIEALIIDVVIEGIGTLSGIGIIGGLIFGGVFSLWNG